MMKNRVQQALDSTLSSLYVSDRDAHFLLAQAKGGRKVKKKLSILFIAFAVLLLCLATAFAMSSSYVLQYLFPKDELKRKSAEECVQNVEIVRSSNISSMLIKDALIHGDKLSVGLSASGNLPIYIVTQSIYVDGIPIEVDDSTMESQWASGNPVTDDEASPRILGFTVDLSTADENASGKRTVRVVASLLSPNKGVKQVDFQRDDISSVWHEVDEIVASGMTPVSIYEPYEILVGSEWMLKNKFDKNAGIQYPLSSVDDYLTYSNMKLIDKIDVSFDIKTPIKE